MGRTKLVRKLSEFSAAIGGGKLFLAAGELSRPFQRMLVQITFLYPGEEI